MLGIYFVPQCPTLSGREGLTTQQLPGKLAIKISPTAAEFDWHSVGSHLMLHSYYYAKLQFYDRICSRHVWWRRSFIAYVLCMVCS